jgi:hypothetical protein
VLRGGLLAVCASPSFADLETSVGFDQYHEPPDELPAATRTFARMCASLTEEAEAIGWYEQRIAVEADAEAKAIMRDAQGEEFKHFSMDLEFLLRRTPVWREIARGVLFRDGDIVERGEAAEASATSSDDSGSTSSGPDGSGALGIGGLRGSRP